MREGTPVADPNGNDRDIEQGSFSGANVAVAAAVVLISMVFLAVLAYNSRDVGQPEVIVLPDSPAPPVTSDVPDTAGQSSALVGMTEDQVRELYVHVRVVEEDGQPLPSTMDLQPGRINLVLNEGIVTSSFTEGCEDATADAPGWVQQACSPDPDTDGPDTVGTIEDSPSGLTLVTGTEGDSEYQGILVEADGERTVVFGRDGSPSSPQDLRAGDDVSLWVAACAESAPPQCSIEAIVVG